FVSLLSLVLVLWSVLSVTEVLPPRYRAPTTLFIVWISAGGMVASRWRRRRVQVDDANLTIEAERAPIAIARFQRGTAPRRSEKMRVRLRTRPGGPHFTFHDLHPTEADALLEATGFGEVPAVRAEARLRRSGRSTTAWIRDLRLVAGARGYREAPLD